MMKYSFRTMIVMKSGDVKIITQDSRRRKNVVTGIVSIYKMIHQPFNIHNAKSYGCNILVREK